MTSDQRSVCGFRSWGFLFLVAVSALSQSTYALADQSISEFSFVPNPSGRVPLAAAIEFSAPPGLHLELTLENDDEKFTISGGAEWMLESGRYRVPVVGMRASARYSIALDVFLGAERLGGANFLHETPSLPGNPLAFPPFDVKVLDPKRVEPGVTFLSVRRRALGRSQWLTPAQHRFSTEWGMLLALDVHADVRWWYESEKRTAGIERLHNGNILMHRADFSAVEIDLLGFVKTQYYAEDRPFPEPETLGAIPIRGVQTLHHQPKQMPNGDFLSFSANGYRIKNWLSSETDPHAPRKDAMVMADTVMQFSPAGEVVWRWNTMDHLDPFRIGYDTFWAYWWVRGFDQHMDWTHGNGVSYDVRDDSVLISLRNQAAVLKIDRKTSEIKWILGRHDNWSRDLQSKLLTPIGPEPFSWQAYQHNPRVTEAGTVILFDNHAHGGAMPFEERPPAYKGFSRGVEFVVDEVNMTVRQIWASSDGTESHRCFTNAMSDAWRLPKTDNRLVIHAFCLPQDASMTEDEMDETRRAASDFPYGGRILEFSDDEIVLWIDVVDPNDLIQWEVYGGFRSPGLYTTREASPRK